jgi:hypothetical protein
MRRILIIVAPAMIFSLLAFARSGQAQQAPAAAKQKATLTDQRSAAAPRHDVSGTWEPANGPSEGIQPDGVKAMPNDGKPEHQLPYTPYGLQAYKSHKALEGYDSESENEKYRHIPDSNVDSNDPRVKCEPLGFPRMNHYHVGQTEIAQEEFKIVILYQNDERYRIIWTDGRDVPTPIEGGVHLGKGWGTDSNSDREQRYYGYSVGKWVDDTTLVVETLGTMPEDRVWLDETGRPISDQVHVTETFHRVDHDHLELTEMINDPKMYTKPWLALNKAAFNLGNPHQDPTAIICSPLEIEKYYEEYGNVVSGVDAGKK